MQCLWFHGLLAAACLGNPTSSRPTCVGGALDAVPEGLSLIQNKAEVTGLGRASPGNKTKARGSTLGHWPAPGARLHRSRRVLPAEFPSKVESINATYDDVDAMARSVNDSILGALTTISDNLGMLNSALGAAQALADTFEPLVGEKRTDMVDDFVVKMQGKVIVFASEEQEYEAQAQHSLQAVLDDFSELRERVTSSYNKAGARVDELSDQCSAGEVPEDSGVDATLLQLHGHQARARGRLAWNPFGWLKGLFGGGRKKSPCEAAEQAVREANDTAIEVAAKLDELNSTVEVLLTQFEEAIQNGITSVNTTYTEAMEQLSGFLPGKVKDRIDTAVNIVFGLATSASSTPAGDLYKQLNAAKADMLPLYEASDLLLKTSEPCCRSE